MFNFFGSDDEEDKTEESEQNSAEVEDDILQEEEDERSLFGRLKDGLKKSRRGFVDKLGSIFTGRSAIDEELYEELEETLIRADVGVQTTMDLISELKDYQKEEEIEEPEELYEVFQDRIREILQGGDDILVPWDGLEVLMVVGVNGSGKTTTIAKLANRYKNKGNEVLLAAGDTFRAGAIEQIETWGRRLGIDVISQQEGADAAAVAYDAVQAARSRETDLLIVDTAGRLHTQKNLMQELEKVRRVIGREAGEENVEVLLVLDATTGQNALHQAEKFDEAVDVDGIALTKLDGTASGGIVVAVRNELGLPIRFIGVGEQAADLQNFDPDSFVEALFTEED
ncbi:signal recognition particle-docking protein FtsY [Halarsenatibacter silvermanii]|uniref:Signal recognition particle receptor FtsY n=1 Tax=Halarsenatibacter silvermanii TaxID=321763 RepID=A0A1G9PJU8_9FIRM|nr:signal recognition particle-docking protein FtsY [Halarsenatibacter silvermanii]SDL98395.1 fused signal recognition particle receptor [Halarsenatibacter silvermanii]